MCLAWSPTKLRRVRELMWGSGLLCLWLFPCGLSLVESQAAPQGCSWSSHGPLEQIKLMGNGCRSSEIFCHSNFSLFWQEQQLKSLFRNKDFSRIVVGLCLSFPICCILLISKNSGALLWFAEGLGSCGVEAAGRAVGELTMGFRHERSR